MDALQAQERSRREERRVEELLGRGDEVDKSAYLFHGTITVASIRLRP